MQNEKWNVKQNDVWKWPNENDNEHMFEQSNGQWDEINVKWSYEMKHENDMHKWNAKWCVKMTKYNANENMLWTSNGHMKWKRWDWS